MFAFFLTLKSLLRCQAQGKSNTRTSECQQPLIVTNSRFDENAMPDAGSVTLWFDPLEALPYTK